MLEEIKAYWYDLKTEYENIYGEAFLKDFDKSKEYIAKNKKIYLSMKHMRVVKKMFLKIGIAPSAYVLNIIRSTRRLLLRMH